MLSGNMPPRPSLRPPRSVAGLNRARRQAEIPLNYVSDAGVAKLIALGIDVNAKDHQQADEPPADCSLIAM